MDRSSKQNINKVIVTLNNDLDEMDLIDIYRAFHAKEAKYTFFLNAHGTFSKTDHMIGHKTSLNKLKRIEIISNIFSNHKGLKLETDLKEKLSKHSNSWRLHSMLLNNEWVKKEIREEFKKFLGNNENELTTIQNLRITVKVALRGKFPGLPKKHGNISNKQPNPMPIRTQETTTKTTYSK